MKVLLVNPPQTFYPGSDAPAGNLPLGLLYIAAVLEKAGSKVEVLDAFMTDVSIRKIGDTAEIGMPYERIAEKISRDHLTEFPKAYYTELAKMEERLKVINK